MPELPEVEILVRHLARLLPGRRIAAVDVRRAKSVRPHAPAEFARALVGAEILGVRRRAKYLVFDLRSRASSKPPGSRAKTATESHVLLGHLGMTGRMYLAPSGATLPRHAAVVIGLGAEVWVFEDTRYFGRLTLDASPLAGLGPEPLDEAFTAGVLAVALQGSRQAVKVKLLDQSAVAGVGNIYASEALHQAGIAPRRLAGRLRAPEIEALHRAIRSVLREAIRFGSTVPLNLTGPGESGGDGLFYYGAAPDARKSYVERLLVYDRDGQPCRRCGGRIRRIVQANRSTYFCPQCQH